MPRAGAPRRISDEQVERVLRITLEESPQAATHWSTRSLAALVGLSRQAVHRIWRAFGLQPHRQEVFTLSKDPYFSDKVRDVVDLFMNPPENALVLCVDEKSQIQALERSQPVLPMRPGRPQRWSHELLLGPGTTRFLPLWMWQPVRSLEPPNRAIEAGNLGSTRKFCHRGYFVEAPEAQ